VYRLLFLRFTSLFLSIALALPPSAYALRTEQSRQADHVLSGLEEALQAGLEETSDSKSAGRGSGSGLVRVPSASSSGVVGVLQGGDWLVVSGSAADTSSDHLHDTIGTILQVVGIEGEQLMGQPVDPKTFRVDSSHQARPIAVADLALYDRIAPWKQRVLAAISAIDHFAKTSKAVVKDGEERKQVYVADDGRVKTYRIQTAHPTPPAPQRPTDQEAEPTPTRWAGRKLATRSIRICSARGI